LCYTAAGFPDFVQCLASSTDGRTFTKYDGNPVLNQIVPENRDPKIFWHEPTRRWVMALYIPTATGQTNAEGQPVIHSATRFLSSPNLKQWTVLSSIDSFAECPDLFELPLDGNRKKQKWILSGAAGRYMVGQFDGTNFVPETETIVPEHGRGCYAAQTFNDTPDKRRIQMSWLPVTVTPGMPFNQAISLPCELRLRTTPAGPRLTWTFVKELERLRVNSHKAHLRTLKPGDANPLRDVHGELLEVRADIEPGAAEEISFNVRGVRINYDAKQQELVLHTTVYNSRTKQYDPATLRAPAPLMDGHQRLVVYLDRTLVEVTASDGLTYLPASAYPGSDNQSVDVSVKGGPARIHRLEAYELKSSWE
jgi:sucrose-6-phosphate hydrolase SacC (GH32 family)